MNRREMLKFSVAGGLTLLGVPSVQAQPVINPEFFTHNRLMLIYEHIKNKCVQEKIDLDNPLCWTKKPIDEKEAFYISWMRMTNCIHRKTMTFENKHWMVMSPSMCERNIWWPHQFGIYDTFNRKWVDKHWRENGETKKVSPNVFKVGMLGSKSTIYVDEKFPSDVIMLGSGDFEVWRLRFTGKILQQPGCGPNGAVYEYPETTLYKGKPTIKNYALIKNVKKPG
jgi:hypothetical protein